MSRMVVAAIGCTVSAWFAMGEDFTSLLPDRGRLCRLDEGETRMVNALWIENPPELKMGEGRNAVTIADLKGPAVITMIHFAMPEAMNLTRDTVLRIWWDGEKNPSVDCPLVDFFCDPNGALERVDTALVNKKRGWNCYFPMPFARSARIEISCENPRYPATWQRNPCYSYVMYRTLKRPPRAFGYFYAQWHQHTVLMGRDDYEVFEAIGGGQFIGWNMTIRGAGSPEAGYPVDENEKFYIDGEAEPSIEWQGLEDSFGFSYGFPETANSFAYTGWQPYYRVGAAAYRFCANDRIVFRKSLRMTVGFGKHEHPMFREMFSKPENALQLSSVAYWYQKEPHRPMPALPGPLERMPAFFSTWSNADAAKYEALRQTVVLNCGKRSGDIEYLEDGWDFVLKQGYLYEGWPTAVNHCWADFKTLNFEIACPRGATGVLKLYIIDGDNFAGGRKQAIAVAGRKVGIFENFQQGQWVDIPIAVADTAEGRIPTTIENLKPGGNAVVSLIRFEATN
ncbi:MAG: DUF2961 domain-containing protein [Candidatus Hydrogenedentes bacterium]|nr:DUF2961 domain-containing protein [Candidatus Hydrogenedentota bacterium]